MGKYGVLVVGRGKLAAELLNGLISPSISRVLPWSERERLGSERCMVVHAGSGRERDDAARFCADTGSILLELSTGGSQLPPAPVFPIIVCPNVNMQMLSFMAMIKQAAGFFKGQHIEITESHQASKRTEPGTAIYLARSLGIPETQIRSVRDPKAQSEILHIPTEFLDRHAYHEVRINNGDVEIRLESRVLGKSAYASGLARIIEVASTCALQPGVHDVVDVIPSHPPAFAADYPLAPWDRP